MLLFTEVSEDVLEDDVNINANDETHINAVVSTFMRRDLKRTEGFCNLVVPALSIDEFKNHFRMHRSTFEVLLREVSATGCIPQQNCFGRAPIPHEEQVLAFVWLMSNSETIRSVSDRFDMSLSSMDRIIHRITAALCGMRHDYIKWPTSKIYYSTCTT